MASKDCFTATDMATAAAQGFRDGQKADGVAVPEGWKLVPVEPTEEMIQAAEEAHMPFGDMDIALRLAIISAPAPDPVEHVRAMVPSVEQLAEALNDVRCFHDLSAELIAPQLRENLARMNHGPDHLRDAAKMVWAVEQSAMVVPEGWRSMDTAPKDGTMVRLLVDFDDLAIEDEEGPLPTIGCNQLENTDEDEWKFVGWNWEYDHFTDGKGAPVGWLPMLSAAPTPEPASQVSAEIAAAVQWCKDNGGTPAEFLSYQLLVKRSDVLGRQLTWEETIELVAITTSMPDEEKRRLLALDDEQPAKEVQ